MNFNSTSQNPPPGPNGNPPPNYQNFMGILPPNFQTLINPNQMLSVLNLVGGMNGINGINTISPV